jgi:hypothetical protein
MDSSKRKVNGSVAVGDDLDDRASKRRKIPNVSEVVSLYNGHLRAVYGICACVVDWRGAHGHPLKLLPSSIVHDTLDFIKSTRLTLI